MCVVVCMCVRVTCVRACVRACVRTFEHKCDQIKERLPLNNTETQLREENLYVFFQLFSTMRGLVSAWAKVSLYTSIYLLIDVPTTMTMTMMMVMMKMMVMAATATQGESVNRVLLVAQATTPTATLCPCPTGRWCVWTRAASPRWSSTTAGSPSRTPSAARTAFTHG